NSEDKNAKCYNIPNPQTIPIENIEPKPEELKYYNSSWSQFGSNLMLKLNNKNGEFNECNDNFCCSLKYSVASEETLKDEAYYFIATNGTGYALALDYPFYQLCI